MRTFSVAEFGARGDGATVDTAAIQGAIDACRQAGGGRVTLGSGCYVTGTLHLCSHLDFHLESDATLLASTDEVDYPDFSCPEWDKAKAPRATSRCLLYAGYCRNLSLTGLGTIDCRGGHFCVPVTDAEGRIRYQRTTVTGPARMIFLMGCSGVRLTDFTLREMAGGWGCWINHCRDVSINKVRMCCHPGYPNSDGIHINCSADVVVSDCIIHSGDDSLVVRANTNTLAEPCPCERIVVTGCVLSSRCNAIRIGWRNDGVIRDCVFSGLAITDSTHGLTIELPSHSNPTDVGTNRTAISNLQFSNILLSRIQGAPVKVIIQPENLVSGIRNIHFMNLVADSGDFPLIIGRVDAVINDISFSHCRFNVSPSLKATGPLFQYVRGLCMSDTTFCVMNEM